MSSFCLGSREAFAPPSGGRVKAGLYSMQEGVLTTLAHLQASAATARGGLFVLTHMRKSGEDRGAETLTCIHNLSVQAAWQRCYSLPTSTSGCNTDVNNLTVGFMGFFLTVGSWIVFSHTHQDNCPELVG